jgi:hypothetical protein
MSSQRIKNTLSFANLAPAASIILPHGLKTSNFRPLAPDIIFIPNADLEVTASTTESITIKNNGVDPLSGSILLETWHTLERTFDGVQNVDLPVKPYIVVSASAAAPPAPSIMNPMPLPEVWVRENIGSEGPESGAMDPQVSQNFPSVRMIRAGSLVGIRARVINTLQDGELDALTTINGVVIGLVAHLHSNVDTAVGTAPPGTFPYNAGDLIGVNYDATGDLSPTSATMEAWVEVYEEVTP